MVLGTEDIADIRSVEDRYVKALNAQSIYKQKTRIHLSLLVFTSWKKIIEKINLLKAQAAGYQQANLPRHY